MSREWADIPDRPKSPRQVRVHRMGDRLDVASQWAVAVSFWAGVVALAVVAAVLLGYGLEQTWPR